MKIVADNGEGCTVEEGTPNIDIATDQAVLVLRPDMTHRLVIPATAAENQVPLHVLALTAVAILMRDNPEWVEQLCTEVFGEDALNEMTSSSKVLGPDTEGSA